MAVETHSTKAVVKRSTFFSMVSPNCNRFRAYPAATDPARYQPDECENRSRLETPPRHGRGVGAGACGIQQATGRFREVGGLAGDIAGARLGLPASVPSQTLPGAACN
jgi:hypothetical protein